ncbi:MAG: ATP-binding cassette domain-containing protein, partial [Fervidobacterium sp.]
MEIRLRNITFSSNNKSILKGISTTFVSGEVVMVIGSNGSGKSTLLKILSGIVEPTSGDIVIPNGYDNISLLTGYVFQNPETQII